MSGKGEIFLQQIKEVTSHDNCGILLVPTYFEPQMSSCEANDLDWREFRQRIRPLAVISVANSGIEYLITPKNTPWGAEDVNIFAGEEGRKIEEIDNFAIHEGESFLRLNFSITEGLLAGENYDAAQITIGFNTQDLSYGHHSVLKLHSHIRIPSSKIDASNRQRLAWQSLDRYDKMAFIEPFAPLYHDYIEHAIRCGMFSQFLAERPKLKTGYTTLSLKRSPDIFKVFKDLKTLYSEMKSEYANISEIFTDGSVDPITKRFILRSKEDRFRHLEQFLTLRDGFYSSTSTKALSYLTRHIHSAKSRDPSNPKDMSSMAMIYLTNGFAGGLTFAFKKDADVVRLDFLPFVLTTSSVTKTMLGEDSPTIIVRPGHSATDEDHKIINAYHQKVITILQRVLPPDFSKRSLDGL